MPRDRYVKEYVVDNSQFSEMKQIGMQRKIAENSETAILHDPRPTTSSDRRFEVFADGRKIGTYATRADAESALNREP